VTAYLIAMGILVLIYALLALGLNLHFGYTGLINFGHVAFFAVGAYTSAILNVHGVPVVVGILAAIIVAALITYPIGLATLRLREDYLAIVTLALSEVVRIVALNEEWLTRGPDGISGITHPFAALGVGTREIAYFIMLLLIVIIAYVLLQRLSRSPFGRTLQAIREDEDAVTALGKSVVSFKMRSLVIGAALAGLAGALYAHYIRYVVPEQFIPLVTFYVWIAVILGGSGNHLGAIIGTIALVTFMEGSRFIGDFLPFVDATQMAAIRFIVVGLALILLLRFRPEGLLGKRVV
jgi:branched-chain amino acid transport system permease protein